MRQFHENKSRMYQSVAILLIKKEKVWKTNLGFSEIANEFISSRSIFDKAAQAQAKNTKGITDDKNAAKAAAIKAANLMAGNARAYAKKMKNHDLFEQMNFAPSTLTRMSELKLKAALGNIHDAVEPLTDAGNFGINTTSVKNLKTLNDKFSDSIGDPKTARSEKKTATMSIDEIVDHLDESIDLMDGMIGNFEDADPDFVTTYHNVRSIDDYGHGGGKKPEEPQKPQ